MLSEAGLFFLLSVAYLFTLPAKSKKPRNRNLETFLQKFWHLVRIYWK